MKAPRPAPKIGILGPPTQSSSSGLFLLLYLPSGLPWPGNRRVRWGAQSVTFGDCRSLFGHEILFCDYLENMFLPSLFIFLLSGCGIRVKMFIRKGDGKHSSLPLPTTTYSRKVTAGSREELRFLLRCDVIPPISVLRCEIKLEAILARRGWQQFFSSPLRRRKICWKNAFHVAF